MKLKVIHIITRLDSGGSAYNTLENVARSDKDKIESTLLSGKTNDANGEIKAFLRKNKIDCIFIDKLRRSINPIYDTIAFFKIWKLLRKTKYDLVHTHTSKAGILGRWAARFAGVKHIVHTPHGHIFHGYFNPVLTRLFIWMERLSAGFTDKIITLTDRGKEDHIQEKIAKPEKFVTVYSGIDVEYYKEHSDAVKLNREDLKLNPDTFVFGTCGRLEPIKGHRYLIEAMPNVLKQFPDTNLLIIGDGDLKEELMQQAQELQIKDHVTFTGFQKDVRDYLHLINCFVLPSLNEGMGRSILEAMACGKPVIATNTGGIPELVEPDYNGMLVPTEDAKSLSEAMISFLGNSQKGAQFGRNSQQRADSKFSVNKMVKDIDELYLGLAK